MPVVGMDLIRVNYKDFSKVLCIIVVEDHCMSLLGLD